MPEHLRALVEILLYAAVVFALGRRPAVDLAMAPLDFERRRNLWFAITLIAFLSHNFWIFAVLTCVVMFSAGRKESNVVALFVLLLFAVPPFSTEIPGFGIINYLMKLDYIRLLEISLLLPAFFLLRRRARAEQEGWRVPDVLILAYVVIQLILRFPSDSATNTARFGVYAALDVGLPYYVASRSLRHVGQFREVAMAFVIAALVLALIGVVEAVRWWLLYSSLDDALGVTWGYGNYLGRTSILRAQASTGHPIVFGYVMVVALALYGYVGRCVKSKWLWWLGLALLLGALAASFSRGPWLGALVALIVFRLSGSKAVGGLFKAGLALAVTGVAVLMSPLGDRALDLLPFVGSVDVSSVDYRQHLLEVGISLIRQEPWFGVTGFRDQLLANDLEAGGIVDLVNTYLGIGLAYGLITLACFVGAFAVIGFDAFRAMRRMHLPGDERRALGCGLLAALAGIAVTIFTVSSITVVPVVYWTVIGVGAGYVSMLRREAAKPAPTPRRAGLAVPSRGRFAPRSGAQTP